MVLEEVKPKEKFWRVRQTTEHICAPLSPEDYVVQPVVDVSPPKWHLGHTTWFFETFILIPYKKNYQPYDQNFGFIFNSYYESVGERLVRTNRGNLTRPALKEVMTYRQYVDEHMDSLLEDEVPEEVFNLLQLGLQHEQQHQELLFYDIKYILGHNPLLPAYLKQMNKQSLDAAEVKESDFLKIEEGVYQIGHQKDGFCFDNEKGVHKVFLHEYAIMDRLVTNGEYLQFVEDGGYNNFRFWLSDGWDWVNRESIEAPDYWYKKEGVWYYYSLKGGLQQLDLAAPVTHISYYEADAYAKWKDLRLPTEFEWEVAANIYSQDLNLGNFMESDHCNPTAKKGDNYQFLGDVWEWTSSAYLPYPYYEAPAGAVGEYNGKFMVNQMVLRGGSCATPANHVRTTYRNFFHPHLRWMFSGLRLAKYI
ncbi:ergothioneine biosynthesis protein EgtB [Fulvivirga sediminis]|uniref:Ergothioneine biosynthesis protein EgtB n=1 Tax=Fulvivirga sediminis TaxID=2803949 RepID=A0A937F7W1_9BACT|nr:ergothioneine biosynthesis protein EgtB [Fulvivirga sediminis]MBL3656647.1 ergothioneine biosynthesis protein EgtB [Fulvivirga sediminis]